ncbi:MAG: hypothetical protein ABIX01_19510 [Chitinophagaceae bacterium]
MVAARYPGLGAYSKNNVDLYATRNNAAALAHLHNSCAGIYAERRFLQEQLNLYNGSLAYKTKRGAFALHGNYYGFSGYNQMQLSLAYGLEINDKVDVGVQFNYHSINQGNGYGKSSSINASAGAVFHPTEKMHLGINVYNPGGSKWSKSQDEKIPARYSFGLGFEVSDKLFISSEMVKEESLPATVNAGLQYRFIKQFFARTGVSTATNSVYAGIGFNLPGFRIDLNTSYHPQLGLSPGVLLLFDFGKKDGTDVGKDGGE